MAKESCEFDPETTCRPLPKQVAFLRKKADRKVQNAAQKSCLRSRQFNSTPILPSITVTRIRKPETTLVRNSSGNILKASSKKSKLPTITKTDNNEEHGRMTETKQYLTENLLDCEKMYERMNVEWEHMKKFRNQADAIFRQAFLQYAKLRADYSSWLKTRCTTKGASVPAPQENCFSKVGSDSNLYSWITAKVAAVNTQDGENAFAELLTTKVDPHAIPGIFGFPSRPPSVPCAKQAQGDSNNSSAVSVRRLIKTIKPLAYLPWMPDAPLTGQTDFNTQFPYR